MPSPSLDPQARAVPDLIGASGRPPYYQLSPKDARASSFARRGRP
jgi:hypothetical protein